MDICPDRHILSEVAMGNIPPDMIIENGVIFNVFTREFLKGCSIFIKKGMIAYVGPNRNYQKGEKTVIIDANEMVILPGLIDGHTHINRMCIEEFVRYVIPSGVTTVIMETTDIGTMMGKEGMEYFIRGLKNQPIRIFYTVSPLCGLIPSVEYNILSMEDNLTLLKDPFCVGMGEIYWGNIFIQGSQGQRVRELVGLTLDFGKRVEGHGAGASDRKLQAYTCFGVSSDHEPTTADEVLERLRLGYWVMIREGFVRKELLGVKEIFKRDIDFRRVILSTDGMDPHGFIEEGYLDSSVRQALKLEVPPELVYQMVTINVAEHFRLDHLIGSISPGKMADLVMIPSINEFLPEFVMCGGRVIYKKGEICEEPRKVEFPGYMFDSVKIDDFNLPSIPSNGKVRSIEFITGLVTKERIIDLQDPEDRKDLLILLAIDRIRGKESFLGFLKGFGLKRGAYGTTMSWDTVDMFIVGVDIESIKTVLERLKEIRGGGVYAIGDKVVAEIEASLCGFYSIRPMREIRDQVRRVEDALKENGVIWEKPVLTIDTLGTPAIPHIRITHKGYVRLRDRKLLPLSGDESTPV